MKELAASLDRHYSEWPSLNLIFERLKRKGIDLDKVSPKDLYPYDQSHAGGIEATMLLAQRAEIRRGCFVVDVGCGIGGAARYLCSELACRVVGIDLTPGRLWAGRELNRLTRAGDAIQLLAADAAALPLRSHFADVVWTQHVTMNLPDPQRFLRECARVLKPWGRMACHEWFVDRPGSLPFPLPWAPEPLLHRAISSQDFLKMLEEQAFIASTEDVTQAMIESLERDVRALASRGSPATRIAAGENLAKAAAQGLLRSLIITASKDSGT